MIYENARNIRRSLIEHSDEWKIDQPEALVLVHEPTGYAIWVANGFWFIEEHRNRGAGKFSFIEKLIVAAPALHRRRMLQSKGIGKRASRFRGGV